MVIYIKLLIGVCIFFKHVSAQQSTTAADITPYTSPGTQGVTSSGATSTGAQGIDWDTTSPPLTTPQRNELFTSSTPPDYPPLYDDLWRSMLGPQQMPPYGTRLGLGNYNSGTYPFFRHPDAIPVETNWTDVLQQYSLPPDSFNYGYMPYPPMSYYPPPTTGGDQFSNNRVHEPHTNQPQDSSEKQISPDSSPAPFVDRNEQLYVSSGRVPYPFMGHPPNFFPRTVENIREPRNGLMRNPVPGYYPLPAILPGGPQIYPEINIFVRPPYADGQSTRGRSPRRDFPLADISRTGRVVGSFEQIPSSPVLRNPLPSTPVTPAAIPSGPLPIPRGPLPLPSFPFGILPPDLSPPFPGVLPPPPPVQQPTIVPADDNLPRTFPPESPIVPLDVTINLEDVTAADKVIQDGVPPSKTNEDRLPYDFGYDMHDGNGTDQYRQESSDATGIVTGSYGYKDNGGVYRLVNYIADKNGFRAFIKSNEPGVANPGSADVVVFAERPPMHTIVDSLRNSKQLEAVELVEEPIDLFVQPTENEESKVETQNDV